MSFTFYEFFAGGGMARLGLGSGWTCLFANDFDPKKAAAYRANFHGDELFVGDVATVQTSMLPGRADLVWASFPCQDLSLAGNGAGLGGERSGTFWPFWRIIQSLLKEGRAPRVVLLENVVGLLTSHGGRDFASIGEALSAAGYRFGAIVVDAAAFLPHSRPRLFFIAVRGEIDEALLTQAPSGPFHPRALLAALRGLSDDVKKNWVWWRLPMPAVRNTRFADVIEDAPSDVEWHGVEETRRLLAMMSEANIAKVHKAQLMRRRMVGAIYKRTRHEGGVKVQRAEVRFDDVAGCLRTPGGGSSRQTILVVHGDKIRSRLLSTREAARLMGLPEDYKLPERYNDAYHLAGDGVAVPVVRHLATTLIEPIFGRSGRPSRKAA